VINTNRHPISYRFEVVADYFSNFGQNGHTAFFSPLWVAYGQCTLGHILGLLESSQSTFYSCQLNFFARCYSWDTV